MDWDLAYDNRAAVAGAADFPPRWADAAADYRAASGERAVLDIAYGPAEREKMDLFLPETAPVGLAVFVHGGYWLRFGKDLWSHLAQGPLSHGWAVAVPQYTLCPDIRIAGITRQIGAAVERAAAEVSGPIRLAGHSAGGHLVTRMVCMDSPLPATVSARIDHVLSISGVHDLRPLLATSMNADLRLDTEEATAESPALGTPMEGLSLTCHVGGDELPEFRRQNALLANIWTGLGAQTVCAEEPGKNHFTIVEELENPASALTTAFLK